MDSKLVVGLLLVSWALVAQCGELYIPLDTIVPLGTPATFFSASAPVKGPFTPEESARCERLIGRTVNGVFEGEEHEYDVAQILEALGGSPGFINVSSNWNVPEPPLQDANPEQGPPDDVPSNYWNYNYRVTDYVSYYRQEHGVRRFPGTPKEYLDIRGEIAWTPSDFCGKMRRATYRQDDVGLHVDVSSLYCAFNQGGMVCWAHATCTTRTLDDGNETVSCIL